MASTSDSPTKRWPKQPQHAYLTFREPFTVDVVASALARTIFRPGAVLALPALLYHFDKRYAHRLFQHAKNGQYPPLLSLTTLRLLLAAYPLISAAWIFGLIRLINAALERYAGNLGEWRRDRPDWNKEVVVVTGGARGIGAKVVEMLSHEKRARVAVLDLGEPEYASAPKGAPEIHYYKVDVADAQQVKAAADSIRSSLGAPSILINNAGIAAFNRIIDAEPSSIEKVWRVNTLAHFVTVRELLPDMIKRNHGHIMALTSSASFASLPQMSEYTTSKTASLAFFEVLRGELRSRYSARKIRTSIVCPTKVQTMMGHSMESHANPFLHPTLHPYQVARKMVDAIDSGLSHYIVMPGFMKILPLLRGFPWWLRSLIDVIGHTDNLVNDASAKRAYDDGYGKEWDGAAADDRKRFLASLEGRGR